MGLSKPRTFVNHHTLTFSPSRLLRLKLVLRGPITTAPMPQPHAPG